MIILHNQHDNDSRDFVEKYGKDNIVISYPECVEQYSNISAFPSVVLEYPDYYQPEIFIDPPLDEDGNVLKDVDGNDFVGEIIPEHNVKSHIVIYRFLTDPCDIDEFWKEIQDHLAVIEEKKIKYPPKEGLDYREI